MKKLVSILLVALLILSAMPALAAEEAYTPAWQKDTSPITFSLFMDIPWMPMDSWGNDHVSQKITELTGVSFEVTKAQDTNHLNMIMASGDYPDAIFVFRDKFKYEDEAIAQPWNKLIAQYAPEWLPRIDQDEINMATKPDGNYYTLYTHTRNAAYWADMNQPVSYGEPTLMFRDDIMAELGNPALDTVEDLYNALKACKEKYPDYIPYLETIANPGALRGWFGMLSDYSDFTATDGKLSLTVANQEIMKEYLAFKNKLVREGLMSVEGLTYDFEKQKQAILAGKVFSTAAQIYDVDLFNEELDKQADNAIRYTALNKPLTVNGEMRYHPVYANAGFAGLYITTACKNPERLVQLMEFLKSEEGDKLTQWGVEGLDYTLNAEDLPVINNELEWKVRGDNVWYFGASFGVEIQKSLIKSDPRYAQVAQLMYDFKPYWSSDVALSFCTPSPETDEAVTKAMIRTLFSDPMTNKLNEVAVSESDASFEQRFNALYAELNAMDIEGYVSWAQGLYDQAIARFQ